jgi:hypothetical protein
MFLSDLLVLFFPSVAKLGECLHSCDGGKFFQEVVGRFAPFQVFHQCLKWYTSACEDSSASK